MITKLQLKATGRSKNENSNFEEGKIYSAVCQDNLIMIDCDGTLVIECISDITNRQFDIVSSIDEDTTSRMMFDELFGITCLDSEDKFIPTLVS